MNEKANNKIALQFENVHFSFGRKKILNGFSFQVRSGQKVALTGPSGSGKSTVLNLIMGFLVPDAGTIKVNGSIVSSDRIRTVRQHLAWLPQRLDIGTGKVKEAIDYILSMQVNRSVTMEGPGMANLFEKLSLDTTLMEHKISELSEGQRQRVGLAICLKLQRQLLLLDEPTSALDPSAKKKAMEQFFQNTGLTVLAATHDRDWLERCDKIITINEQ